MNLLMVVKKCIASFLLTLVLFQPLYAKSLDDILKMDVVVHFIDVGIGDATYIQFPNKDHEAIIDGGDRRKGYNISDYLESFMLPNPPIELAVITHADYDHWSGIERLISSGVLINELWDPGYNRDCKFTGSNSEKKKNRDLYLKFINKLPPINQCNSPGEMCVRRPVVADPRKPLFELDKVKFTVLHADATPEGKECSYIINNASIVIRMDYKNVSFLFTGDMNGKERKDRSTVSPKYVEAELLKINNRIPGSLEAQVLKVPHHGSETANTRAFIKAVKPQYAIISSSRTHSFQLPKKRVVNRYQRIYFEGNRKIKKVLRTDYKDRGVDKRNFGDDHIICGTNGEPEDLVCDYLWNLEE